MALARKFSCAARPYILITLAAAFFFLVVAGQRTDAHKPVTSKYDSTRTSSRCCRSMWPLPRGGPAPMSLMTYKDAVPWAESIRDESPPAACRPGQSIP